MHLANQSSRKLDKLSQGSSKLDKLSQNSMGNTLDKREATDSKGNSSRQILSERIQWIQRSRAEGNARSRNNPDSRLPMLQEAMNQA